MLQIPRKKHKLKCPSLSEDSLLRCIFSFILFVILPVYVKPHRRQRHYDQRWEGLGERSCHQ